MSNFNQIIEKFKNRQAISEETSIKIFVEKRLIFSQKIKTEDFGGGIKSFVKVVNSLTLSRKGKSAEITFLFDNSDKPIVIQFISGKFSINLKRLIEVSINKRYGFMSSTEISNRLRENFKNNIYSFIDSKIEGIVETIKFLNFVEKVPLIQLEESFINFKLNKHE